jgi:hypothetical protein
MRCVIVLVASVSVGCGTPLRGHWHRYTFTPPSMICLDGAPLRVLVGASCHEGICGWTCAPDRWLTPVPIVR